HYESRSRGIAVALPGATADEGSTAPCLESRRGIIIAGNGVSGRTRINEECLEMLRAETKFEQCVALADRLAEWGQLPLAYEQLKRCGAVEGEIVVVADDNFVTREQLDRAFADAVAK